LTKYQRLALEVVSL